MKGEWMKAKEDKEYIDIQYDYCMRCLEKETSTSLKMKYDECPEEKSNDVLLDKEE